MRWFEMQVALDEGDLVEVRSILLKEQERSGEGIKACSICLKLQVGDRWLSMEDGLAEQYFLEQEVLPELQHEICRLCFESMYEAVTAPKRSV